MPAPARRAFFDEHGRHRARALAHRDWKNVRFTTAGFGPKKPAVSNTKTDGSDDPARRQKNRCVEIVISKK
jgi:outer membrane protein OmpA-like peptidoglycan-associated protein